MTVTYEPPRLNGVGSLNVLIHEEGPNADVGSFRETLGDPICAAS
jgi:hypothetical protein